MPMLIDRLSEPRASSIPEPPDASPYEPPEEGDRPEFEVDVPPLPAPGVV